MAEYGWKPHRDFLAQKRHSPAPCQWYMHEKRRGTVSSNSRFKQYYFNGLPPAFHRGASPDRPRTAPQQARLVILLMIIITTVIIIIIIIIISIIMIVIVIIPNTSNIYIYIYIMIIAYGQLPKKSVSTTWGGTA